jgi:hypothetical protein
VIEVLVHLAEPDEPGVAGQPWAQEDLVTYEIRWQCPDPAQREQRYPSEAFLASRARVAPLVRQTARSITEAVGGVLLDEDGFSVDRYML